MILVTGGTGNVGREVAAGLHRAGAKVRTTARHGGDVRADLTDLVTLRPALDDVDTVFLVWPGPAVPDIEAAVAAITAQARKVVYLSALSADSGFWGTVEQAIEASGAQWVFLRPGGFATNTLGWADMIRAGDEVRWPYGEASRSLIHEKDIADVAVRALLGDDLNGQRLELTGPANITQAEQARVIGAAIGRPVRWVELPPDVARQQLLLEWGDEGFVDGALGYWASLVGRGEPVTDTVTRVTGQPGRTFTEWAADHVADFR